MVLWFLLIVVVFAAVVVIVCAAIFVVFVAAVFEQRALREQCSVEHRGTFVCSFVHTCKCASPSPAVRLKSQL